MAIDIDDEVLARAQKLEGVFANPIGMSEGGLRDLKNRLIGDPYRKKQFLLGSGLNELFNIAKISCSEGKAAILGHVLEILASVVSVEEAMPRLLDLQLIQLVIFVIQSSDSYNLILPALKILQNIVNAAPVIELPLAELVRLTQSGSDRIVGICLSLFARYSAERIGIFCEALLSCCFSGIRKNSNVVSCLDFFHSVLQSKQQWDYRNFPMDAFLSLIGSSDSTICTKAILCVSEMPSALTENVPEFSFLLKTSFQIFVPFISQKERSGCFFDQCIVLSRFLHNHPFFIPDAQPAIVNLVSVLSGPCLEILGLLAANSEVCRRQICSQLDFQAIKPFLRKRHDLRLSAANLMRIISRSFCSTRVKLFKIGMLEVLFDELTTTLTSPSSDNMTDVESLNDWCFEHLSDDDLQYAIALMATIANLLIEFKSIPRPYVSRPQLLLLVRGAKSGPSSFREVSCLALRNWCFNPAHEIISELLEMLSISDLQSILQDPSEKVQFNALALLRNVLAADSSKLWNDYTVTAQLICQLEQYLEHQNQFLVLEALTVFANIAAGFRIRKIVLLSHDSVLESVRRLFDHSWPEMRLMSIVFFDNLFCRAFIFKKQRMAVHVPITRLLEMNLTASLTQVQIREKSRGNHDAAVRAERAIRRCEKCLHVLHEILQPR